MKKITTIILFLILYTNTAFATVCPALFETSVNSLRAKQIYLLFVNGMSKEDEVVGYHGTSLEAINQAIQTGFLPAAKKRLVSTQQSGAKYSDEFGIWLTPVRNQLPSDLHTGSHIISSHGEAQKSTEGYANAHAEASRFLDVLSIPWTSNRSMAAREMLTAVMFYKLEVDSAFKKYLQLREVKKNLSLLRRSRSFTDSEFRNALITAIERRGFVVAIKKMALEKYKISDLFPDEGFFLDTGKKGLPLDLISGLAPLGQEEWNFLDSLRSAEKK